MLDFEDKDERHLAFEESIPKPGGINIVSPAAQLANFHTLLKRSGVAMDVLWNQYSKISCYRLPLMTLVLFAQRLIDQGQELEMVRVVVDNEPLQECLGVFFQLINSAQTFSFKIGLLDTIFVCLILTDQRGLAKQFINTAPFEVQGISNIPNYEYSLESAALDIDIVNSDSLQSLLQIFHIDEELSFEPLCRALAPNTKLVFLRKLVSFSSHGGMDLAMQFTLLCLKKCRPSNEQEMPFFAQPPIREIMRLCISGCDETKFFNFALKCLDIAAKYNKDNWLTDSDFFLLLKSIPTSQDLRKITNLYYSLHLGGKIHLSVRTMHALIGRCIGFKQVDCGIKILSLAPDSISDERVATVMESAIWRCHPYITDLSKCQEMLQSQLTNNNNRMDKILSLLTDESKIIRSLCYVAEAMRSNITRKQTILPANVLWTLIFSMEHCHTLKRVPSRVETVLRSIMVNRSESEILAFINLNKISYQCKEIFVLRLVDQLGKVHGDQRGVGISGLPPLQVTPTFFTNLILSTPQLQDEILEAVVTKMCLTAHQPVAGLQVIGDISKRVNISSKFIRVLMIRLIRRCHFKVSFEILSTSTQQAHQAGQRLPLYLYWEFILNAARGPGCEAAIACFETLLPKERRSPILLRQLALTFATKSIQLYSTRRIIKCYRKIMSMYRCNHYRRDPIVIQAFVEEFFRRARFVKKKKKKNKTTTTTTTKVKNTYVTRNQMAWLIKEAWISSVDPNLMNKWLKQLVRLRNNKMGIFDPQ